MAAEFGVEPKIPSSKPSVLPVKLLRKDSICFTLKLFPLKIGGWSRICTGDLTDMSRLLYSLSYPAVKNFWSGRVEDTYLFAAPRGLPVTFWQAGDARAPIIFESGWGGGSRTHVWPD